MQDIIVIGIGLIGSAALRHLSSSGLNILGLGPDEPADWHTHTGVFASYYDQGRITRRVDPDPVWALLGARAINDYANMETASGIRFHEATGCLRVSADPGLPDDTLDSSQTNGLTNGAILTELTNATLGETVPMLRFPGTAKAILEQGGAGYINPRQLVQAQLIIAQQNGTQVRREQVCKLHRTDGTWAVSSNSGAQYRSDKVLIAAGAFTNGLLDSRQLDLRPRAATTLLARIDESEARRLSGMPSVIYRLEENPDLYSIYALPPIHYPDDQIYLKIGGTFHQPHWFADQQALRQWFKGQGESHWHDLLWQTLCGMIPDLRTSHTHTRPCAVTYTAHGQAYIDQIEDQLFVAVGGCGAAAKSSTEIGRIAAGLVQNERWTYDVPAQNFSAQWMAD